MKRIQLMGFGIVPLVLVVALGMARVVTLWMGKQPDGSFIVSTGQRIEGNSIAFRGRPIELAVHPSGVFYAVLNKDNVFLGDTQNVLPGTAVLLGANAGFRGLVWSPNGAKLYASTDKGKVREFAYADGRLAAGPVIEIAPEGAKGNPVAGGMAITRDGATLFVAAANRNSVCEIDLKTRTYVREFPVQNLPFEPRLSADESTLVVSNWGGRPPLEGENSANSVATPILIDDRGVPASGTVSIINRATGKTNHVDVGLHPTAVLIDGSKAYVANAMSDSISEIDLLEFKVSRTITLRWGDLRLLGGMPNALSIKGRTLYVADGGDNAIAELDLDAGVVKGFRPAGYFPTAMGLNGDGTVAFVLNTKGNGSVARTVVGKAGNAHDFQGTVTVIDLKSDLKAATQIVARNNRWEFKSEVPPLKVYQGAIKHVIYIIKENRTYDEVYGDLPQGNGDKSLCSLGESVMPNHRKIAREFSLFDNGYVSGTNSADGHQWSTQSLANDYLEHFYVGYSRTYPDDGEDPMALSAGGALWDAAAKHKKSIRVYGEFCDDKLAIIEPMPKDWFEVWEDRKIGGNKFTFKAQTSVKGLKPYIHPEYQYWPLFMSDQHRADLFIKEYKELSSKDALPDLTIMSLPCDHGEGTNPAYPTPRAMMADNDLALGRIVEAVSQSPQWKETCIFVIEDDAQSGPDHVDGHRTVFSAISPYTKRRYLDSTFYTTTHMIRSIEMMLGLDPMNRFDALSYPMVDCFSDTSDLTPFVATTNNVPLNERNPAGKAMTEADRYWLAKTMELDWSHIDAADPYWLNRINWYSIHKGAREYPGRPDEMPGQVDADDD